MPFEHERIMNECTDGLEGVVLLLLLRTLWLKLSYHRVA